MKIHILADLHNEFEPFKPPSTDADLVVLAGDTDLNTKGIAWAQEAFTGKPVLYVPGNHEYYGEAYQQLRAKMQEAAAGSNVHVLDCGKYEQDGVVFLGATLWTDFSLFGYQPLHMLHAQNNMNDFARIRTLPVHKRFKPQDTLDSHIKEKSWLEKELKAVTGKKVVVVTHHLPSLKSVPRLRKSDPLTPAFASRLDELVAGSGAVLWVHGHTHTACDYLIEETRVICNPRGYTGGYYQEHTGYDPDLVVEI